MAVVQETWRVFGGLLLTFEMYLGVNSVANKQQSKVHEYGHIWLLGIVIMVLGTYLMFGHLEA